MSSTKASKPEKKPYATTRFYDLNYFVDMTMRDLPRGSIAAWLVLYRDTKPDGTARTGMADIARRSGISLSTAKRAVAALRERGLVVVVRKGGLHRGPSTYRVVAAAAKSPPKGPA